MERRPELTIIAGPNGAGKSRLCPLYLSTHSFDGDKLMLNLRREHPDWPDRWVSGTVASELEKQKRDLEIRLNEQTETMKGNWNPHEPAFRKWFPVGGKGG
jgi:predicted ABC-type ATPase